MHTLLYLQCLIGAAPDVNVETFSNHKTRIEIKTIEIYTMVMVYTVDNNYNITSYDIQPNRNILEVFNLS